MNNTFYAGFALAVVVMLAFVGLFFAQTTYGSAPSGLEASVATTSAFVVGPTDQMLLATSTNCAARIVATRNSEVQLKFSEFAGGLLNGMGGVTQAASTTVAYDGGIYGCGSLHVYSFSSSTVRAIVTR